MSHTKPGETVNHIKVGDVVLVHCDILKRQHWPLAVVSELTLGKDGIARSAVIKTKNGVSNRPITKLYPLEVCSKSLELKDSVKPSENHTSQDNEYEEEQLTKNIGLEYWLYFFLVLFHMHFVKKNGV